MQVSVLGAQLEVQGSVVLVTINRLRIPIVLAMILRGAPSWSPDAATVPEFCKVVFNLDLRSQTTKPPSQAWFAAHGF